MTARISHALQQKITLYTLIALLALLYAGWIGYQWQRDRLYDFNLYYIAANGFKQDVNIYALARDYASLNAPQWAELAESAGIKFYAPPYRYPPLTAQLVLPLTYLHARSAGLVWLILTAFSFAISAWLMGKIASTPEGPALALGLMLLFVPPLTTLHAGQVNGFVLLALMVSMWALAKTDDLAIGIGIAVAALLKVVPVVLLLYLFWRKQWRTGLICLTALAALLLTAPLTFSSDILSAYFRNFFVMGQPGTLFAMPPNQSLNGLWARLLGGMIADETIYRIYLFSALAAVAATLIVCWPMRRLPVYWRYEFALIVCVLNMITPYAWYHQLVLLFIPLFIVVEQLWARNRWAWLAVVLALLALADLHGLLWHSFEFNRWLTSFPLALNFTLAGLLAWSILDGRRASRRVAPVSLAERRR